MNAFFKGRMIQFLLSIWIIKKQMIQIKQVTDMTLTTGSLACLSQTGKTWHAWEESVGNNQQNVF